MKRGNQKEPCSPAYLSSVLFPDSLSILSVGKKEKRGQEKNTDVGCAGEKEEEGDRTDEKRKGGWKMDLMGLSSSSSSF